jgi:hypothetical protein
MSYPFLGLVGVAEQTLREVTEPVVLPDVVVAPSLGATLPCFFRSASRPARR